MPMRVFISTAGEGAPGRSRTLSSFANTERKEGDRALLSVGAIVLALALVEFSRHWAQIPPRLLAAVAASMALALVAVGVELGSGRHVAATLLAAAASFSLACFAGPGASPLVLSAAFAVQALSMGALARADGVSLGHRGALLRTWCLFQATVAASLALGS